MLFGIRTVGLVRQSFTGLLQVSTAQARKEIFALLIAKCLGYSFLGSVFTAAFSRAFAVSTSCSWAGK